jgi:triacylglycerol lipase
MRTFGLAILAGGLGLTSCINRPAAIPAPRVERVVLVHGFLETGSTFKQLRQRLEKRGVKCQVVKLIPSDGRGGLATLAAGLKRDIDSEFGSDAPISLVAFSMGGLVSRYYLQDLGGATRCENFITVSSPHHGTKAAFVYPSQGAKEMRPGSSFLQGLAQSEHRLGKMPVASYRTPMDLIILPPESSVWDRAENLEYRVPLHPLMLSSSSVLKDIERRLLD